MAKSTQLFIGALEILFGKRFLSQSAHDDSHIVLCQNFHFLQIFLFKLVLVSDNLSKNLDTA